MHPSSSKILTLAFDNPCRVISRWLLTRTRSFLGPSQMAAAKIFWLHFLNNRSSIQSFFEISGPSLRSWRFFLSEWGRERRSREALKIRVEAVRSWGRVSHFPRPNSLAASLLPRLVARTEKPPTTRATSGLSPFSNMGYEMAPAVYGPFLSRFICSYYGKTYLPIVCFGDVIDN